MKRAGEAGGLYKSDNQRGWLWKELRLYRSCYAKSISKMPTEQAF